ncbi:hypothetical protein GCM10010317_000260 [Streptomyces mirabilis]|nr:hypothetical protein GCM10010317_000260 [Streptomyces mirabilis]
MIAEELGITPEELAGLHRRSSPSASDCGPSDRPDTVKGLPRKPQPRPVGMAARQRRGEGKTDRSPTRYRLNLPDGL